MLLCPPVAAYQPHIPIAKHEVGRSPRIGSIAQGCASFVLPDVSYGSSNKFTGIGRIHEFLFSFPAEGLDKIEVGDSCHGQFLEQEQKLPLFHVTFPKLTKQITTAKLRRFIEIRDNCSSCFAGGGECSTAAVRDFMKDRTDKRISSLIKGDFFLYLLHGRKGSCQYRTSPMSWTPRKSADIVRNTCVKQLWAASNLKSAKIEYPKPIAMMFHAKMLATWGVAVPVNWALGFLPYEPSAPPQGIVT